MSQEFYIETLPNGLTVLGHPMPNVSSAALSILVPAGAGVDPEGAEGASAVAAEWLLRGAGNRDTRQLNDALDNLGCQHHERVHSEFVSLSAAQLGRNLNAVLEIYADILRRPRLGEETFGACRALTLQDLGSLEDEPSRKAMMMLREQFYPPPYGRCVYGTAESLQSLSARTVQQHAKRHLAPGKTVIAAAGNVDWPAFFDAAQRLLGDWESPQPSAPAPGEPPRDVRHVRKDSAQTHIALAHRAAGLDDPLYYAGRLALTVLSGGMSSRLFTEVREKRGLAYHVASRYHAIQHAAGMFTYAGTRPDLAQQTFDVTVGELRRLAEGLEDGELTRARVQAKSALVMQGESTSARASAMVSDWFHLGRLRSLDEIADAIDAVKPEEVAEYLEKFPARDLTVLVIGPEMIDARKATEA